MSRLVSIGVFISMFFPVVAAAHDVFVPDWRGLDGTTYEQWWFGSDVNPAVPEFIDNDYGSAIALIIVGEYGSGWLDNPGLGTQTGMWDIGGSDGQIVLDIDNQPLALDYKQIWLQVTYYQSIGGAPIVDVPGAQLVSSQTVLIEEDMMPGMGWYLDQSIWRIEPNPSYEQIILTGNPGGSVIDQIVVDTYCIPEPASMALLIVGGFIAFKKQRRRQV